MAIKKKLYNLDSLHVGVLDTIKKISRIRNPKLHFGGEVTNILYKLEVDLGVFYLREIRTSLFDASFGSYLRVSDGRWYDLAKADSSRVGDRCIKPSQIYSARDVLDELTEEQLKEVMEGAVRRGGKIYLTAEKVTLLEKYLDMALAIEVEMEDSNDSQHGLGA